MNHRQLRIELKFYSRLKKTTQAIKLVTLSKLQRVQMLLRFRKYSLLASCSLFSVFNNFVNITGSGSMDHLVVYITTERSCCGPIDQVLSLFIQSYLNQHNLNFFKFFFLGRKGYLLLKKKYETALYQLIYKLKSLSFRNSSVIAEELFSTSFNFFHIFHNIFENVFTQLPSFYIIPSFRTFIHFFFSLVPSSSSIYLIFSARKNDLLFLKDLYDFNFCLVIHSSLNDNYVSEIAGRVSSMDLAIQNLSEIIQRKTILFQKSRQNAITNELIEIISCLNVLVSGVSLRSFKLSSFRSVCNS
jgi:F-type H+-transporting ATPase subunit gamma